MPGDRVARRANAPRFARRAWSFVQSAPHAGMASMMLLASRGMTIAGGTSEVTRNQIAERILGMPRDPLIK